MKIRIVDVQYHGNGSAGESFHVVRFEEGRGKNRHQMVGVVFSRDGHVAVFDVNRLVEGDVSAETNGYVAQDYDVALQDAIAAFETARARVVPNDHVFVGENDSCQYPYYAVGADLETTHPRHLCGLTRAVHEKQGDPVPVRHCWDCGLVHFDFRPGA